MSAAPDLPILPYGQHTITDDDIAAVAAVMRAEPLSGGPVIARFEAALENRLSVDHAIVLNSGTAALHVALLAAGIGPGHRVVVPTVTFLATANAVRMAGAEVVFADVDPDTGLMTTAHLDTALKRAKGRVQAVIAVHLNGAQADMQGLAATCQGLGVPLIADACHALGADDAAGQPVGACRMEQFACFSLHPVKAIAMGEGGIVTTGSAKAAAHIRALRSHHMERRAEAWQTDAAETGPWYYEMAEIGYNYRPSSLQAALGLSQLGRLNAFIARRQLIASLYDERFTAARLAWVKPVAQDAVAASAYHLYPLLIDFDGLGQSRSQVMQRLSARGIGTQVHYIPVHTQPYYRNRYGEQILPGADKYYRRCLSIPIFPAMTEADVDRVVGAIVNLA